MNNTIKINDFAKRQLNLAKKRRLDGDYVGALNLLNTLVKNEDVWEYRWELALNYMSMGLCRIAVEQWFKFLNICPKDLRAEAYNGLGAAYYRMDDIVAASYYYDLLQDEPFFELPDFYEERLGFYEIATRAGNRKEDYKLSDRAIKEDIERLIFYVENNCLSEKVDKYIPLLQRIPETDEHYFDGQICLVTYYVLRSKLDLAYEIVGKLEEEFPDNPKSYIQELIIYADGFHFIGKKRAREVIKILKSFDITDVSDCYQIIHACIAIKEDKTAIEYCKKVLQKEPYNLDFIFAMGTALYNDFEFNSAEEYFTLFYQITGNVVAKYNLNRCRNFIVYQYERMSGLMMLPEDVSDKFLNKAIAYSKKIPELTDRNRETFFDVLNYIFAFPNDYQQKLAIALARSKKPELIKYSKDLLLKFGVIDTVKLRILAELIFIEENGTVGVTFEDFYSEYKIKGFPDIPMEGDGKIVKLAHAIAASQTMVFMNGKKKNVNKTTLWVYETLKENGNIDKIKDEVALAVAIIVLTVNGIDATSYGNDVTVIATCLNTTPKKVMTVIKKIRTDLQE